MSKQDRAVRAVAAGKKFQASGKQIQGCGCAIVLLAVLIIILVSLLPKEEGGGDRAAAFPFKAIGSGIYTVIIPRDAKPEAIDRAARAQCAGKSLCDVWGWVDADRVATAPQMTNRETAARIYSLKINRNTGYDRSTFACSAFPSAPKDQCSEPPSEAELENAS